MEPNSTKNTLPLIPLDDVVVFPGMNLTLAIDAGPEEEVLLVPRSGEEFAAVGTVARDRRDADPSRRHPRNHPGRASTAASPAPHAPT